MTSQLGTAPSRLALPAIAILMLGFGDASARILNVPDQFNTIQTAVDSARREDTVLVRPGRYPENLNLNGKNVTLGSLFLTTGETHYVAETVIDGGWNGRSAVRMAAGESGVLTGFTIENDSTDFGGGVYVRFGSPTLSHLVIQNCYAARNGAAIYVTGAARPSIRDVVMRRNDAFSIGGAMSVFGESQAVIERALMDDNYAGHVGGALHVYNSSVTLRGCTIARNAALHTGGSVYLTQGARVEATDCIMWENEPDEVWILAGGQGTAFSAAFCNIDGSQDRVYAPDVGNLNWGVGNINADPLFADPEDGDFALTEDSPGIDAGNYESAADPDGTRRDIGAIYFHQAEGGQRVRNVPAGYQTIQAAIDAAVEGDVVLVQPGIYQENIALEDKNITLAGKILTTGNEAYIDSTIIDGGAQRYGIAFSGNITNATLLRGFTIRNGRQNFGGGVDCQRNTAPLLEDLVVRDNTAVQWGGGVYCSSSAAPILRRVTIRNNSAYRGGGMASGQAMPTLEDCVVKENTATERGGGFIGILSAPALRYSVFSDNRAGEEGGGGVFLWDNSFRDNDIILANLTVANNEVANANVLGGGVAVKLQDNSFTVRLSNSIVYGNGEVEIGVGAEDDDNPHTAALFVSYTDVRNAQDGVSQWPGGELNWLEGNFDADPQFVDPDNGDFHLAENSPCIDAGDPASPPDPDETRADVRAFYFHQLIERQPALLRVPDDYSTIQTAINASADGDTILVSPGRFEENINFNGKNVILGSWFLTTRDPRYVAETVIDGGRRDVCAKFIRSETSNAQLTGFTLVNGESREGGGVFCFRASPSISYSVITGNAARDGGGGIYLYGAGPALVNLTVLGNTAEAGAGGLHLRNSAYPTVVNCIFRDNGRTEIVYSADRDANSLTISFSDVTGGEDGVLLSDNGSLNWEQGNFDADPLFVDANNGDYRLREESPCIDSGDPDSPPDLDGSRADVGALAFDDRVGRVEMFSIQLQHGWNLIGSPIPPPDPTMQAVWGELVADGLLTLVKDQDGRFYWPDQGFNNIPGWDARYGYQAKMSDSTELTIEGLPLPADEPIPLREGWSIASYLPSDPATPEDAFAEVVGDIVMVKDGLGRFYVPRHRFSNMPPLQRGNGYQVKTANEIELVWNVVEEMQIANCRLQIEGEPEHFAPVEGTGRNMSFLLNAECRMENGEWGEIGVFTKDGLCVGASAFQTPSFGLAIRGDDPTTPETDGAIEGEALRLKVWDGVQERPVELDWTEGGGTYRNDGFSLGRLLSDAEIPTVFALHRPYPNPFNSATRIDFALPEGAWRVSIRLFDVAGRTVTTLVNDQRRAGRYNVVWQGEDGKGVPVTSGVYFVRFEAGSFVKVNKMTLVR